MFSLALLATVCFASAVGAAVSIRSAGTASVGGVNFVAEGFDGPLPYDAPASLASLAIARDAGVSVIVFSFPWYVDNINSTAAPYRVDGPCPSGVAHGNVSSPTDAAVVTAVRAAQALGLRVVLRPMLDLRWDFPENTNAYRGNIGLYFNESQWDAWFASHDAFLLHWAHIGSAEGVDTFCVGAELVATQPQDARWRATFAAVRGVFNGSVYYSTNDANLSWWDASDYIAVDAYPALTNATADPDTVPVAQLVAAWAPFAASLRALSARVGVRALLSETGICAARAAGLYSQPWFFRCYGLPPDMGVQAKYYEAVLQALWGQDFVAGVFFWKWSAAGGADDPSFFPLNKTAMAVMRAYFGRTAVLP